jgi:hypothetical protein
MPGPQRDPLAVAYERHARAALVDAIRTGPPRISRVFIASPGAEFTSTDRGGRTRHERAFTRAAYYEVQQVPRRTGTPQQWSLRLEWSLIERRGSRYGRVVTVRMFRYGRRSLEAGRRRGAYLGNGPAATSPGDRMT